jgi:hypothetical protein
VPGMDGATRRSKVCTTSQGYNPRPAQRLV